MHVYNVSFLTVAKKIKSSNLNSKTIHSTATSHFCTTQNPVSYQETFLQGETDPPNCPLVNSSYTAAQQLWIHSAKWTGTCE